MKTAPVFRRRVTQQLVDKLLILDSGLVLDGLSGALHVFTETVCRMATGKDNLAHNCEQNAEQHSFRFIHFSPSFAVSPRRALITAPTAPE